MSGERPGWLCSIAERTALLRHGDVVLRDSGEATVDTRVEFRDGSVRVRFTDGTDGSYTSTDRVVRWRKVDEEVAL